MTERDRVVLVSNRMVGRWEPVDFRNGQHVVAWPHGFRHELLPIPDYQEGDMRRVHVKAWYVWCSCKAICHASKTSRRKR